MNNYDVYLGTRKGKKEKKLKRRFRIYKKGGKYRNISGNLKMTKT